MSGALTIVHVTSGNATIQPFKLPIRHPDGPRRRYPKCGYEQIWYGSHQAPAQPTSRGQAGHGQTNRAASQSDIVVWRP